MGKSYWDKLKDPRWQKKRLEILQRAGFCCELCGSDSETLHCLCEYCHHEIQQELGEVHETLAILPPELLFDVRRLLNEFSLAWPFHFVVKDYDKWKSKAADEFAEFAPEHVE